jgi:cytochrome c biogenesis protein CcmG/thiol:disulfide interchange protein DsbE
MRTAVIVGTAAVLATAVIWADRATRKKVREAAARPAGVDISAKAPDVVFKDLSGKSISLGQYQGRVVLLNFWATWCDPCQVEIPWLIEMQEKYGPRGFTVLGVAMDDEGKSVVGPFVQKERFTVNNEPEQAIDYPIVLGSDEIADKFGLMGYPTSVLISPDGHEVKRFDGLIDYDELAAAIQSLLR